MNSLILSLLIFLPVLGALVMLVIAKAKIENPSKTNITGPPFDIKSKLFRLFKFMNSSNSIKKHNN